MNYSDPLWEKIEAGRERMRALVQSGPPGAPFQEAVEELSAALEEIYVAAEELRGQNEQVAAAQDMIASERRQYQDLFEFAPVGYLVTDSAGVINEASLAAGKLLGVHPRLLRGRPVIAMIEPGKGRELAKVLSGLRAGDEEAGFECSLRPRGGEPFPARLQILRGRGPDGETNLRWLIEDVSELRALQAQARAATERGPLGNEMTADLVVSTDVKGIVKSCSMKAGDGSVAEVLGKHISEILPGGLTPPVSEVLDRIAVSDDSHLMRAGDGASVRVSPLVDEAGKRDALFIVMHGTRTRLLSRLVGLDDPKAQLLRSLAHDIGNPLAAIAGIADLIEATNDPIDAGELRVLLSKIHTNAARIREMISDLVVISQMSVDPAAVHRTVVDLGAVVSDVASSLTHEPGIVTQLEAVTVEADAEKVRRVIENLIGNAVKYGSDGQVSVRLEAYAEGALITVDDDGPGVPDTEKERIFQPLRRGTATGDTVGSGLGLSIVAAFVDAHEGSVWVEDRDGGGASFRVYLPSRPGESR